MVEVANTQDNTPPEVAERNNKAAVMALLFRKFPEKKLQKILGTLPEPFAQLIIHYMQMPNLEQQLTPEIINKYMNDFRNMLPGTQTKTAKAKSNHKIHDLLDNYPVTKVRNIIKYERNNIKEYLEAFLNEQPDADDQDTISPHVSNVVYNYLKEKLAK